MYKIKPFPFLLEDTWLFIIVEEYGGSTLQKSGYDRAFL
jgi:hypothetical protein